MEMLSSSRGSPTRRKRSRQIGTWGNILVEYRNNVQKVLEVCAAHGILPGSQLDRNGQTLPQVLVELSLVDDEDMFVSNL